MTPASARETIEEAIEAAWTDTPIAWPDYPFTPPTTGMWLKVDFLWGQGTIFTKDDYNQVIGVLQLSVVAPKGTSDGPLLVQTEEARTLVNREEILDISFGAASGPVLLYEESWRQAVVSIPFRVVELVS